jgi:GntR family transcriptional repressor for pyruvate dehydrogenase complex
MTTGVSYRAVARQPRLADQVAQQIRELIADGNLQPGDRLPTERELADSFGVSRTVVREALRALGAQGLVDLPGGRGAVVSALQPAAIAGALGLLLRLADDPKPYRKLFEVRRLIEVEAAGLAATRARPEDLATLETIAGRMSPEAALDQAAEADVAFHAALAQATGNELFGMLLGSLTEAMLEMRQGVLTQPGAREQAVADHQHILARVQAGDEAGARQAMLDHLADGERRLLGSNPD